MQQYRLKNKDKINECGRKYYERNKDKINEYKRKYYERNKDKMLDYGREYYHSNKDKINKRAKEYNQRRKEKVIGELLKIHDIDYETAKAIYNFRLGIGFNKLNESEIIQLKTDMVSEEGAEFAEMVLNGLPNKFLNKA